MGFIDEQKGKMVPKARDKLLSPAGQGTTLLG